MAIQKIYADVTCKFMGTRPGKLEAEYNTETGELTGHADIKHYVWQHADCNAGCWQLAGSPGADERASAPPRHGWSRAEA